MKWTLNPVTRAIAGGLLAGSAIGVHAQAAQEAGSTQIERITITAEKRVTVLDTTPAAITALNGSKLAEQGATSFADMLALSPNTSFTTGQGASQIFVRGIGNVFILAGGDPGVALYADGSYVSDQTSSNVSLFDTQRVEVLRGPQGALYGRNATGGAMNLISARPTANFQAKGGLLIGNHGRKEAEGFVSGPIGGGTLGRLSFQVKELDGYTDNPLAGQAFGPVLPGGRSTVGPDKLDDQDSRALRLQTATDFAVGTNLRVIAGHYRQKDAGPSMPLLADPVMIPQLLFGAVPSTDPRVVESQGASNRIEVNSLQTILEQPIGAHTLRATLSWRKSEADRFWDSDTTEALVATSGFSTRSTDRSIDVHLVSEEGQALQWLIGATHLRFDQQQDIDIQTQIPLGFLVPGAPLTVPVPGGVAFQLGGKVYTRSSAVYGDFRYALTPKLALLGGLRYNRDSKRADEYQNILAFGLAGRGSPSDSWTSTPASIGAEYKFSAETLAYARVASGFKSGAVNLGSVQGQLVKPEKSLGVELGFKSSFWQRRGAFSAALFSTDYKDMQVSQVGTATVILANASKARIHGLEMELGVKPAADWTLGVGIGLMDPRYTDFVNTDLRNLQPPRNVKGNQLAFVSKSQAALSAEWTPVIAGMRASLRADYVWKSRVFFTEFNTPDATQEAYGLLNVAASIRPADGRWKLHAWVRNATDKTAITSMSIASPLLGAARQVTYTPPRQVGLGASLEF
jgi:iron complex outermembrane recepter protein